MKHIPFYLSMSCLLVLAACESGPVESPASIVPVMDQGAVRYTPHAVPARAKAAIAALSTDEKAAYKADAERAKAKVMGAYYSGATTAQIDALAEEAIASQADNPYRYYLEQSVSGLALALWLDQKEPPVEAVARHTRRLLDNAYPDARALVPALEALRGTWSSEQLRAAAAQVQQQARRPALGKQCEGCTTPALERAQTQKQRNAVLTFDEAQTAALDRLAQARF